MKVAFTNETDRHVHIGPVTIAPGMTRDVEDSHIPGHKPDAQLDQREETTDPLAELLKRSVKDVVAEINGMPFTDIERLGELEQQGQARKGVLTAVSTALLDRAANSELLAKVAALSDDELAAALVEAGTDVNADPDYVAALEAESAKRKAE